MGTAVIIVNYNGLHFLGKCLSSLAKQSSRNFMVVVVDNNSSDGSVEFVRRNFRKVGIIRMEKNVGFSAGNNAAFVHLLKDRNIRNFIILNNDTYADRNFVKCMINAATGNERAGSVACKVIRAYDKSSIDSAGIGIRKDCMTYAIGNGLPVSEFSRPCSGFGAHGTAALYKREMLEDVGLFDADYSSYSEESDLSWRAFGRGWKCVYEPQAIVYHEGSGSWRKYPRKAKYLLERNGMWTIVKNLDTKLLAYCLPHIILYQILSLCFYAPRGDALTVLKARIHALLMFPLSKRAAIQNRKVVNAGDLRRMMTQIRYRSYL